MQFPIDFLTKIVYIKNRNIYKEGGFKMERNTDTRQMKYEALRAVADYTYGNTEISLLRI